jgi:hypothetical protein
MSSAQGQPRKGPPTYGRNKQASHLPSNIKIVLPEKPLIPVSQPFQGDPPSPIPLPKKEESLMARANPILHPNVAPLAPAASASIPAAPSPARPKLKFANPTPDQHARVIPLTAAERQQMEESVSPQLREYAQKQQAIVSKDSYRTDTVRYMPPSRRGFYTFVDQNYTEFRSAFVSRDKIDQNACTKMDIATGKEVEAFLYQQFIREYIRNAAPYRGILVYHGLGSGKTCSSISAAEALYGTSNKQIIVMTPASLKGNFMSEISFCGFRHFNTNNHWVAQSIYPLTPMLKMYAQSVLSLSDEYLLEIISRKDVGRRVIWIINFDEEPNYKSLSAQQQHDIREQITHTIEKRVTFISYNGISA